MTPPHPLESILVDIEKAIDAGLFYLAVHLALSVPDICGSLECDLDPDKPWKKVEKRYKDWFTENLSDKFSIFTVDDCWAMRGGVVHNGTLKSNRSSAKYDRIVLTLPSNFTLHECVSADNAGVIESALQLDAVMFCQQVRDAARQWALAKKDDPIVSKNLDNLVRLRPNGIFPHFVGVPVIA